MLAALCAVVFMLFLSTGLTAAATLTIVNGDFEDGIEPGPTATRLGAGSADITGWTILPTAVDYVGGFWDASSGVRWVDLDGSFGEAGGIAQTVATTPGETYTILFDMAGSPVFGAPTLKTMQVSAAGSFRDYAFSVIGKSAQNMGWETRTFTFTARAVQTTITFLSTNDPPGIGPAVDNVRAAGTVPLAPASWGSIKALYRLSRGAQ